MEVRDKSRDATSSFFKKVVELVKASMGGKSKVKYLKALTILFRAHSAKLDKVEIPYS